MKNIELTTTSPRFTSVDLANRLADDLLGLGEPPCERIALMTGKFPKDESSGGMCRQALVAFFNETIMEFCKQ